MRYSSTVPPIMALLRTRRASLRSSYLVLVTPFNSHDVIQTPHLSTTFAVPPRGNISDVDG
jgi:hypothetical protein